MEEIKKTNSQIGNSQKFPRWIIYILILIVLGLAKGSVLKCNRERAINDAVNHYNGSN